MSSPLIPDPDVRRIVVTAQRQGCTIRPTSSGVQILTPSGPIVTVHRSRTSNRRRLDAVRTALRKAGVTL